MMTKAAVGDPFAPNPLPRPEASSFSDARSTIDAPRNAHTQIISKHGPDSYTFAALRAMERTGEFPRDLNLKALELSLGTTRANQLINDDVSAAELLTSLFPAPAALAGNASADETTKATIRLIEKLTPQLPASRLVDDFGAPMMLNLPVMDQVESTRLGARWISGRRSKPFLTQELTDAAQNGLLQDCTIIGLGRFNPSSSAQRPALIKQFPAEELQRIAPQIATQLQPQTMLEARVWVDAPASLCLLWRGIPVAVLGILPEPFISELGVQGTRYHLVQVQRSYLFSVPESAELMPSYQIDRDAQIGTGAHAQGIARLNSATFPGKSFPFRDLLTAAGIRAIVQLGGAEIQLPPPAVAEDLSFDGRKPSPETNERLTRDHVQLVKRFEFVSGATATGGGNVPNVRGSPRLVVPQHLSSRRKIAELWAAYAASSQMQIPNRGEP